MAGAVCLAHLLLPTGRRSEAGLMLPLRRLLLLLAGAPARVDGHIPGQVCHSWTREFGCHPPPPVSVWPSPRNMSVAAGGPARGIQGLQLLCDTDQAHCDDVLQLAMERYDGIISGTSTRAGVAGSVAAGAAAAPPVAGPEILTLTIHVEGGDPTLNATKFLGMDESYTLSVPSNGGALLVAPTTLGALRGLETFAQLVDYTHSPPQIAHTPVTIADTPRFPWRGLRLDSSRHFCACTVSSSVVALCELTMRCACHAVPVRAIKAALDTMASGKYPHKW
jgi:hypothetical protein